MFEVSVDWAGSFERGRDQEELTKRGLTARIVEASPQGLILKVRGSMVQLTAWIREVYAPGDGDVWAARIRRRRTQ